MRHVRLFTPLIIVLCHLAPLQAQTAQEEWEFLRQAAKEVELYLPNQAIVNESDSNRPQNDEMIDEISTGQAAPTRAGPALRWGGW